MAIILYDDGLEDVELNTFVNNLEMELPRNQKIKNVIPTKFRITTVFGVAIQKCTKAIIIIE
jgi:hypothetical protein